VELVLVASLDRKVSSLPRNTRIASDASLSVAKVTYAAWEGGLKLLLEMTISFLISPYCPKYSFLLSVL
jgi:hypothetical protein